jgi:ribosomal-protein-alanine N-acetyltransferase
MKYIGAGRNSKSLGYTMTLWIQLAKFACFETDHFVLRPFSYEDGEDFYTIVSHAENLPFIFPVLSQKKKPTFISLLIIELQMILTQKSSMN